MKYMGSKRWMLENGLGHLLRDVVPSARRFVDLFTGSAAVASFVAQKIEKPVVAFDLQEFCTVLARSIVSRVHLLEPGPIWDAWHYRAVGLLRSRRRHDAAMRTLVELRHFTRAVVDETRIACEAEEEFLVTKAYGGHYFSQAQALWIDALRTTLPQRTDQRTAALAALIRGVSQCAAAPGHTAQPFQPTRSAKPFLYDGWKKDVVAKTKRALEDICAEHAKVQGTAAVTDANEAVEQVGEDDVVFIDPPYSDVHYSRFYHVLETIARGHCSPVSGIGRYPPPDERPRSKYSVATESRHAVSTLLQSVAEKGATAIVTFPDKRCSNGISSYLLRMIAAEHFRQVKQKLVRGKFSTLGGDGEHREARQVSTELVLVLRP